MNDGPKLITSALRDFAVPVPRTGSIETHSGYGWAADEGREIHARVQKRRVKADSSYEPEVQVSCLFDRAGYRFQIDGRMDGIFHGDLPHIEEIKTSFNVHDLANRLSHGSLAHPYSLQLLTYGYFHWLNNKVLPKLSFHLVSTRSRESLDLGCELRIAEYETWLGLRLDELVIETAKAEKRVQRRRKIAACFTFPFENPRPGQTEIVRKIEEVMSEGQPLLMQAPTGMGKTVGVLYPVLKQALGRGQQVIYITPKNSQHSIAEDACQRFAEAGSKVKALTITAKKKICFKNEPLCNPDYCEFSRDYYAKVREHGILDLLALSGTEDLIQARGHLWRKRK